MGIDNISIPEIKSGVAFFPSPEEAAEWLGFNTSPRNTAKWLAEFVGARHTLPSDKTLDNIKTKRGVRQKTLRRFIYAVIRVINRKMGLSQLKAIEMPQEDVHIFDIGFFWKTIPHALQHGLASSGDTLDLTLFINFIAQRTQDYQEQFELIKRTDINKLCPFDLLKKGIPYTLLTDSERTKLLSITLKTYDLEAGRLSLLYSNDFYLSLMAIMDNIVTDDISKQYKDQGIKNPLADTGLLIHVLKRSEDKYLGKFFNWYQETVESNNTEMAKHIPLPYTAKSDIEVNQRDRYRQWRNGNARPSNQMLSDYFDNMGQPELWFYAIFMKAIDAQLVGDNAPLIRWVYSPENYARYYEHFRSLNPNT